jgi:hypothetical protein
VLQFSASGAAAAAANLEDMGKTGNLDGAGSSLAQLKSEIGSLMESLNSMIQRGSPQ